MTTGPHAVQAPPAAAGIGVESGLGAGATLAEQAITHIGAWDCDIVIGELGWSDEIYRIFGQTPQAFGAAYQAFLDTIHPADRQRVINAVNASVADAPAPYSIERRFVRPDGSVRWVHEEAMTEKDAEGCPLRLIGTVQDITARKFAGEALLQALGDVSGRRG